MKKFLSLVLALVMTMSLVTIGAGATEYKNLTDKDEIQYEEAVAVLNKLGIITGYEDGSFKPTGALTRGAAAKIIVSLMIGPEAASALTVTAAPYKDVATTNTFAAVISYCKTAGYISGYTDGTFRPTGALTGYAFTKMLLGALGYDGKVEGFTGSGWTMNVAKLGNKAGLFNDFATAFSGNAGVTREGACLLALNTLKATEVEYAGNTVSVTGKDINVAVGNNQYSYVYSNNNSINKNIKEGDRTSEGYTLEFGEEHFTDLKMVQTSGVTDSFGRPANQWNYKNVKVGTYAKTADYTYTTTASGDTGADKVKDMGLKDFTLAGGSVTPVINGKNGAAITTANFDSKTEGIPSLLGKGTLVQVYVSDSNANQITNIVVINSQIMQVKKVNSDNVTLKQVETSDVAARMNVAVNTVNDDDDAYSVLKGLKADDFVVVIPLATSSTSSTYDVDSAYVPTTVTGNISKVSLDSGAVNGVTVSGTDYKLSKNWTVEDGRGNLDASSVSTSVQSTLYMDSYGFMIYAKDVTASSDYMIYDETYANTVDGRIHYFAQGYDMNGAALSLDFGTNSANIGAVASGDLMKYTTKDAPDNADYRWNGTVLTAKQGTTKLPADLSAASYYLDLDGSGAKNGSELPYASDVKFLFLTSTGDINAGTGDVTDVTVKDGAQKVSKDTYVAFTTNDKGTEIKVVVVRSDADVEVSKNIMYVSEVTGKTQSGSKDVSIFTGYIDGTENKNLVANKIVGVGFYTYAEKDGVYTMNAYNPATTSSNYIINKTSLAVKDIASKNYITALGGGALANGLTSLDARDAQVIDLYKADGVSYGSIKDMAEAASGMVFSVAIQYNSSTSTSNSGKVAYIYILANTAPATPVTLTAQASAVKFYSDKACSTVITEAMAGTTVYVKVNVAGEALTSTVLTLNAETADVYSFTMPAAIAADAIKEVAMYTVNGSVGIKMATTIAGLSTAAADAGITGKQALGTEIFVTAATAGKAVAAATLTLSKTTTAGVYSFKVGALDVAANEFTAIVNGDTVLAAYAATLTNYTTSALADGKAATVKTAVDANYTNATYSYDGGTYNITAASAFANGYTALNSGSEQTVAMNVTLSVTISGVISTLIVPVNVTVCVA